VRNMLKILLFTILILLIISILLIILIKKRKVATQIYSIQTFLGSNSYNVLEDEPNEQTKSLSDTINDFFSNDEKIDDDNEHNDNDGDDAGE
jgi:cell shape-determining protein MreC